MKHKLFFAWGEASTLRCNISYIDVGIPAFVEAVLGITQQRGSLTTSSFLSIRAHENNEAYSVNST